MNMAAAKSERTTKLASKWQALRFLPPLGGFDPDDFNAIRSHRSTLEKGQTSADVLLIELNQAVVLRATAQFISANSGNSDEFHFNI
jgi:hypothetical protein